jgi:hypothetical protein
MKRSSSSRQPMVVGPAVDSSTACFRVEGNYRTLPTTNYGVSAQMANGFYRRFEEDPDFTLPHKGMLDTSYGFCGGSKMERHV